MIMLFPQLHAVIPCVEFLPTFWLVVVSYNM